MNRWEKVRVRFGAFCWLEETLHNALRQIEVKGYAAGLKQKGIPASRIRRYGFAFEGKRVLIG